MSSAPEHIILRFLENTITPEEEEILNDWLNEDDRNKTILRQYLEIWDSQKMITEKQIMSNWEKLRNRMEEPEKNTVRRMNPVRRWLSYAAVFVGIILSTAVLYYSINRENAVELTSTVIENRDGVLKYMLPDSSMVWLHGNSQLSWFSDFGERTRRVSLEGDAYFEVRKDERHSFVVRYGNVDVKVTGTEFMLQSNGRIAVTLISGGVDVHTKNADRELAQQIRLLPGQQADIDSETGMLNVAVIDTGFYTAWKDGTYRFTDERLEKVIQQLSFRFRQEIRISEKLKNKRITGRVIPNHTLGDILENICEVYSLQFRKENKQIYISEK